MGNAAKRKVDSIDDVAKYYQSSNEDKRHAVQQLEFAVTSKLLAKYIKQPCRILELGAGSGHYTNELAQNGHTVTSVELVPSLVEASRKRLDEAGLLDQVELIAGDARQILTLAHQSYDVILAMGPFYHLVLLPDRLSLMANLIQRLNPGGLMITSHLTRTGVIGYMLTRFPSWAVDSPKQLQQILSVGHLPDHPRNGEFRGYFTTEEEIRDLHRSVDLEIVRLHSQDPLIGSVDEIFNQLPNELKERWTEILTQLSHQPLSLGSGRSLLCVSRKK
jgi:protein-L-isoaspartate O-methyltransferase